MIDIKKIADESDMIVCGYAFTKTSGNIRILNLADTKKALVLSYDEKILETDMDDIEISIVMNYYRRNKKFLEDNFDA